MEGIDKINKGWGHELIIVNNDLYCGKILHIKKGKMTSWHYHIRKNETFYVESGSCKVFHGYDQDITKADVTLLQQGEKFYVPQKLIHRIEAVEDLKLYEFSTQHFDSDSHRVIKGD